MRLLLALVVLATPLASAQLPAAPETGPFGFHLGVNGDGSALVLQWFTKADGPSTVDVVTASGEAVGSFEGTSELLPQGGEYVHSVELAGLAPGEYAWSVEGEGPTPFRIPGAADRARLAFVADQGVGDTAAAVTALIASQDPDAVFHAGDISYAEGDPTVWDAWFEQAEPVAASAPWLPAIGNHETYYFAPVQAFVPLYGQPNPEVEAARARFALPLDEVYWSWDVPFCATGEGCVAGRVHVVALDSFWTELAPGAPEAVWLAEDLAANADADWTVAFFHDPLFSSGEHGSNLELREVLMPLLVAGGVDLIVTGHDHTYERSWPLDGDEPATTAPPFLRGAGIVHVVSGGGGAELYELSAEQPPWSAARASEHHAFFVEANATALQAKALRPDGSVLDAFAIEAPASVAPPGAPGSAMTPGAAASASAAVALIVALALRRRV